MSELDRALRFVHGLAEAAVTEVDHDGPLTALRTPDLPLVWDANHLRVDDLTGADARALAASAAQRGVPSMVVVPDEVEGERLAPGFRSLGWRVVRLWQHHLEKDFAACLGRVVSAVDRS